MFTNITFGRYIFKNSIIHKLHPSIKLISLLLILILAVLNNLLLNIFLLLFVLLIIYLSNINYQNYLKSIFTIKWFIFFIVVINLILNVSIYSVINNILSLVIIMLYSSVFMYTTTLIEINYAFKKILNPIKKIDIDRITLILTLSLKFIPFIIEQVDLLFKSLKTNNIDFNGTLKQKLICLKQLLISLFTLSFKKIDDISDIIEVRNYDLNKINKTEKKKIKYYDIIFLIINFFIFVLSIVEVIL